MAIFTIDAKSKYNVGDFFSTLGKGNNNTRRISMNGVSHKMFAYYLIKRLHMIYIYAAMNITNFFFQKLKWIDTEEKAWS